MEAFSIKKILKVLCCNSGCEKPGIKRCSRCQSVNEGSYCSADCQKADWRRHKGFCNMHHQFYQNICKKFDNYGSSQTQEEKDAAAAELIKSAYPTYEALTAKSQEFKKKKKYADSLYQLELTGLWLTKLQDILPNAFDSNVEGEGYLPLFAHVLQNITFVYADMHSDFTLPTCRHVVDLLKHIHGIQADLITEYVLTLSRQIEDWDSDLSAPFYALALDLYRERYTPEELLMQVDVADLLLEVSQNVLLEMGQYDEGRSYLREAQTIYEVASQNHPDAQLRAAAAEGLTAAGSLLQQVGNKPNKPRPKYDGDDHPIPGTYDSDDDEVDPWKFEQQALEIRQRLFGREDTSVVFSYESMAKLARKQGDVKKAQQFERQARELKQKHQTRLAKEKGDPSIPRDPEAQKQAEKLIQQAREAHRDEADYAKAVRLYKKAVPLLEKAYGEHCMQASDALLAQSRSLFMLSQYEAATDAVRRAMTMETCRDPFAGRGERMTNISFEFSRIQYKQGRRKEAKEALQHLAENEKDLFGAPKERTLKALQHNIFDDE